MSLFDLIMVGLVFALVITTLIWAYKKRHRLFYDAHFVAETTMMNYQNAAKRAGMEEVAYMKEEKEEDEAGEKHTKSKKPNSIEL